MFMKQISDVFTSGKSGHKLAVLLAVTLALAGFANADSMSSAKRHKAKHGSLKITESTEVGGVILPVGDYEFREAKSPSGPVMEFVRIVENDLAPEGLPRFEEEVVAQVEFTPQDLSAPPKHTQLTLASNGREALEIRGSDIEYVFSPGADGTSVAAANNGTQ
jgi:hypothetical protein